MVEVGRREVRIEPRQEAIGAVVEALARDVDVVRVQHPVHEPGCKPVCNRLRAVRRDPAQEQRRGGGIALPAFCAVGEVVNRRRIGLAGVAQQLAQVFRLLQEIGPLEGADAHVTVRQPGHDRRSRGRWLVVAVQGFAGLDQRKGLGGVDPQRLQPGGGQHLAHPALERQPTVTKAAVGGLTGTLGAEIEQPAGARLPHLREQKAAPVAQIGVVVLELVPVVLQRQWLGQRAFKGLEPPEMRQPALVGQPAQPDARRPVTVGVAQPGLREIGGLHRVEEGLTEAQVIAGGLKLRFCHRPYCSLAVAMIRLNLAFQMTSDSKRVGSISRFCNRRGSIRMFRLPEKWCRVDRVMNGA